MVFIHEFDITIYTCSRAGTTYQDQLDRAIKEEAVIQRNVTSACNSHSRLVRERKQIFRKCICVASNIIVGITAYLNTVITR